MSKQAILCNTIITSMEHFVCSCLVICVLLAAHITRADGYRDDMADSAAWQAMPAWTGNPLAVRGVSSDGSMADFSVTEPGRSMKWRRPVAPQVSTDESNWLLVRYRLVNANTDSGDYALWLGGGSSKGLSILKQHDLIPDGQWHLRAVDLSAIPVQTFTEMAVLLCASRQGNAHLFIDYIAFSDDLPAEAEGVSRKEEPAHQELLEPGRTTWGAVPSWLENPASTNAIRIVILPAEADHLKPAWRFEVNEANRGMKWSAGMAEPINTASHSWLVLRYRAGNLRRIGDYFLYAAGEAVGGVRKESKLLMLSDLEDDGGWHIVTVAVPAMGIKTLAIHVQAREDGAFLEISRLGFSSSKPLSGLNDYFEFHNGWAAKSRKNYTPLSLSVPMTENAASAFRRDGFDGKWFDEENVQVEGIPFHVRTQAPQLAATSLKMTGQLSFDIGVPVGTLYLLLGAKFAGEEDQSRGGGAMRHVADVERFVVELEYADGARDQIFPRQVPAGNHVIRKGLGVYALVPTRDMTVKSVFLRDEMENGAFYLAGATVGKKRWSKATLQQSIPVSVNRVKETAPGKGAIRQEKGSLILENNAVRFVLNTGDGLSAVSLRNKLTGTECLGKPTRLFELGNEKLTCANFKVTDMSVTGSMVRIHLASDCLKVQFTIGFNDAGEITLGLSVSNAAASTRKVSVSFPALTNVRIGSADLWYCFPRRGAVINNIPITLGEPYSGSFPLQFMDFFTPECGGFYLMTHDRDCVYKWFELKKGKDGVGEARVRYLDYEQDELAPGASLTLPETLLGMHGGDWHDALGAYGKWRSSWYKSVVARKQWFREIFNFRQQCLHFGMPEKNGMFDEKGKAFDFEQVMKKDREAFGAVDYLHLFDWGYSPATGRTGDYAPWAFLGASAKFKSAIAGTAKQTPVGLYLEGYLVDPKSSIAKEHGREWEMLDRSGKPYSYFAPEMNMCSAIPAWQDYLAKTCRRVWEETGANGFYIDEMGFADMRHFCYSTNHGHKVPEAPLRGQRDLIRKIREALPPETVLYTEENPVDVACQYQDGSFTYAIASASDDWSVHHLNLTRFALPDFKTIEIITCDHPLGSDYQSVKKIFFNGEAIWLEGGACQWFAPATLTFIRKMNSVQRVHADAFTGLQPRPLVPTLCEGVYANEFPSDAPGKIVWTLYNANYQTVRGRLLAVRHVAGAVYLDEWNNCELKPKISKGIAILSLEVDPRGVGCVVQTLPDQKRQQQRE